ncbi:MAG: adenylate/guanylate cyclase domain-containing protein [Verrucomicrobiia bacterium]
MKRERGTHNFRFLLALAILTPLVVSMTVVGLAMVYFGRLSVGELTGTIVQQTVARVAAQMEQLVDVAQDQNKLNLKVMANRPPRAGDFKRVAAALTPSFEVNDELDGVYYGVEATGEFFTLLRETNQAVNLLERTLGQDGQWSRRISRWSGTDWQFLEQLPGDSYDPRTRPFYQAARSARATIWTSTYEFWSHRPGDRVITGVTCATPVYDSAGRLQGVWGVDLDTLSLCDYLAAIDPEVPGYPFIVEEETDGTRRVIAHPDRNMVIDAKTGMLFRNADEIRDEAVKAFLRRIPGKFAARAGYARPHTGPAKPAEFAPDSVAARTRTLEFANRGTNYMSGYFVAGRNDRLLIGMVLDRNEVMGRVKQNTAWFIATFAAVLIASLIGILLFSRRASLPLVELQREARAMGRLELMPTHPPLSHIREIRELGNAMAAMKTNLRSFRKYVPADLVGDLVRSGREAMLGGERINATVYFSDIAGFTPVAEQLRPEEIVEHLGEYLQAMSDGIAQHGGTVDKFIGDAVMAFWNAPRLNPAHAADACRAALANQRHLDRLNEQWRAAGKPVFRTRIGLHTGPVVVGNIGSEHRMNYTVIGDTVNLASRLETLNKLYGTRILISETTRTAAGAAISARPVDCANIKGKIAAVTVYELLCEAGTETPDMADLRRQTEEAFAHYQRGDYAAAAAAYRGLLKRQPADGVAAALLKRCENPAANPPVQSATSTHVP